MEPPQWLTREFLQQFLDKEQHKVSSFNVELATKPGDNFLSAIYRVTVRTTADIQLSLIVKAMVECPESAEFFNAIKAFPKEVLVYRDLIPQFEQLWVENTGERISFGPKCHYTSEEPLPVIVLDDLRSQGYLVRDRRAGLTVRETKMVLESMAKLHACSVKRFEKHGPYDETLFGNDCIDSEIKEHLTNYYNGPYDQFLWTVENMIKDGTKYHPKLEKLRGRQFELLLKVTRAEPGQLNVFAHCDMWINNVMFQGRDEHTSTDVKLIDFQICRWASPAMELFFFLITSCSAKVFVAEWDNLITYYHGVLVSAMEALKCNTRVDGLKEFKSDLDSRGVLGVIFLGEALLYCIADPALDLSVDFMTGQTAEAEDVRKQIFSSKEFVEAVDILLPFFDKKGYLDFE